MVTVWITGAHGFIGRHLARHMATAGHLVAGVGHGAWPGSEQQQWGLSHWLNGEVDAANLGRLAGECGAPGVIFHLAGGSSVGQSFAAPAEDFARTVTTTANLLEWVSQSAPQARVVMVSSAAVYGSGYDTPIVEHARLHPFSPYGHHKAMAEQLCCSYGEICGLKTTIVRLFSVYGAGLQKQLLWDICTRLQQNERELTLGGSGDELRDWLHIDDAVRLLGQLWQLADTPPFVVNGGAGVATSVADVARMLIAAWGSDTTLNFSGQSRAGDPASLVADTRRLAEFGFSPQVSVGEGIAATVAWYKRIHLT